MPLYAWGWNCNGQLGHDDLENRISPQSLTEFKDKSLSHVVCGSRYTVALTDLGSLYSWGRNDDGQLGQDNNNLKLSPALIGGLEGLSVHFTSRCELFRCLSARCTPLLLVEHTLLL